MPARPAKNRQKSANPFEELLAELFASVGKGVRPGDPGAFEQFMSGPGGFGVGSFGPGGFFKGRGGFLSQNRAGRERIGRLMELLKKAKPKIKQVKRTSPQGNKKLRETVANEEPNLFVPQDVGFIGGFKGPAFQDPFMASFMKGPRLLGLPSEQWYASRGIPLEVRKMHKAILEDRNVKVGDVLELPFPAMKRGMMRDPETGKRIGAVRVEKLKTDALDADVLPFKGGRE